MPAYDVVVLGAGSAGATLAGLVAAAGDASVLVVDAGEWYEPAAVPDTVRWLGRGIDPAHDWMDEVVTADGRVLPYPHGRVVGGSSAVNGAAAVRPLRGDLDGWGWPEWSYDALLPTLVALEDDRDVTGPHHGRGGPLPIGRTPVSEQLPEHQAFVAACNEIGLAEVADLNGGDDAAGVGPTPMNRRGWERVSAADAFLQPVVGRPNLHVWPRTSVVRVVVRGGAAVAVELLREGVLERVDAGEVFLCCGVLDSPGVLWRSGIGPAVALRDAGVPVVADLPGVGRALSDHAVVVVPGRFRGAAAASDGGPGGWIAGQTRLRCSSGVGPPLDLHLVPSRAVIPGSPAGDGPGFALLVALQAMSSRGVVHPSTDPLGRPRVEWSFFADGAAVRALVAGMALAQELLATSALAEVVEPVDPPAPHELADHVRTRHLAYYHGAGTCAMGDDPAAGAVVDPSLRVHGVGRLHVVDASALPVVPRSNPNLTVIAVAARAAALLTGAAVA
jgi:choline dehydrogenase-like flavoprotein